MAVCSADISGDRLLSLQELSDWINEKIQEHISEALRENFGLFVSIDNKPRNGRLAPCVIYVKLHVVKFRIHTLLTVRADDILERWCGGGV
jgi:hypothetical protein